MNLNKKEPNPAITDLREMDVLRFLFELKREEIDPIKLQQMLLDFKIHNQVKQLAQETNQRDSGSSSLPSSSRSGGSSSAGSSSRTVDDVPDPTIVFKYANESDPFYKISNDENGGHLHEYINLNRQIVPSTSSSRDSDSDQENVFDNSQLPKLMTAARITKWCGSSIYNNMPELVMTEYDKMLQNSHKMKVEVIETLNREFPVSYDYNPKKSRIRTNYTDPQIADDRTRNNIASRRSRQRKKFQTQMIQYSVDYDIDENFLMDKQEKWLKGIIGNLEEKIVREEGGVAKLRMLRKQCGFD